MEGGLEGLTIEPANLVRYSGALTFNYQTTREPLKGVYLAILSYQSHQDNAVCIRRYTM